MTKLKFHTIDLLRPKREFKKDWVLRRLWSTPECLRRLCAYVVNAQPLPECFNWTNLQVIEWIESIGFPQYRRTFYENYINGRSLLLVDARILPKMNVRDFGHIQIITKEIRNLYGVELELFSRSISFPPRYPDTHYKLYRTFTGPKYDLMKRSVLFEMMNITQPVPKDMDHWERLTESLKHVPDFQYHRIGGIRRFKLFTSGKPKPAGMKLKEDCDTNWENCLKCYIPPCTCKWGFRDKRAPFIMEALLRKDWRKLLDERQAVDEIILEKIKECKWRIL